MNKLVYLFLIVISTFSCSSKQVNTSDQVDLISLDKESKLVSDILLDDKFSIDDLKLRMPVFLNMLKAAADNEEDVNLRLYAQELSYIYTELLLTKYDNMQGEDQELIESYMKELIYPSNKWFYNDEIFKIIEEL